MPPVKRTHSEMSGDASAAPDPKNARARPERPGPGVGADEYFHNLYRSEIDFRGLARDDPAFAKLLKRGHLDFTDPGSVVQLTKTLLKVDYGLEIELPPDRLCPPVPNRHNYILWLKGLMDSTSYEEPDKRKVRGVDVGTGASCIYPLLGCAQRNWEFIATDIDETSLAYARGNIARNNLSEKVTLVHRDPSSALIPLDDLGIQSADFVMTNPPFYESASELEALALKKARPPLTACTGSPGEMVTPGGEVGFARRLLTESLTLRDRVGWYSTMLGKHVSLEAVVLMLREEGIDNFAVTEFVQGTKTRRWAVAWSFGDMRPEGDVARGMAEVAWAKVLPARTEFEVAERKGTGPAGAEGMGRFVDGVMKGLRMEWEWDAESLTGLGLAAENVWGRAWRRRQERIARGDEDPPEENKESVVAIGFRVSVVVRDDGYRVVLRWAQGRDAALANSLVSFLKGRVEKFRGVEGVEMYVVE